MKFISKEVSRAEPEYMNIHPPPPISVLATALLGAVLSQIDNNGNEHVVAYASKTLSPREKNYSTTENEAFAIQLGTQHFRVYLLGRKLTISTDHSALSWLHSVEPKGELRAGLWIYRI